MSEDKTVEARPIEELLKLDTFQDMSDAEISRVLDYSIERVAVDTAHKVRMQLIEENAERERSAWEALKETGDRLLSSAMEPPALERVENA